MRHRQDQAGSVGLLTEGEAETRLNEKGKLVDFYYDSLQAVRRAQKYYLAFLLTLLAFVWVSYWGKPKAGSASFFGMPLSDKSLLGVTPGISTILLLGLMGCMRAVELALQRFKDAWKDAGATVELALEEIDNHRTWVDYLTFIWSSRSGSFIHGAVVAAALISTLGVGLILIPEFKGYAAFLFASYCLLCLAVQGAASWKWMAERLAISRRSTSDPNGPPI
jgi:hypothetical protein